MGFDHDAANKARDGYIAQTARFEAEAAAYRSRANATAISDEKQAYFAAAKSLDEQAAQVRKLADDMQQQVVAAGQQRARLTFEENMAEANERGKRRGRGDEGLEI